MKKNFNLYLLIPIILAVAVVITFAISGKVTKNLDEKNPTAETEVSVANTEDSTKKASENSKVSLLCVGDNLIHNTLIAAGEQEDGTLDYSCLYATMKPEIEKYDIAVIDQETVLGGSSFEYSGFPVFNSPWEIGDAAIDAGFDVFTCATNHTLDKGWAGIDKELEFFKSKKNVVAIGINANADNNITYYEKNGITFALLNYTYGTNGSPVPEDKPWCINLLDEKKVTADIKQARKNADVVVVFPHWGTEYSHEIDDYQKKYVKLFSDLDVDIVVGGHPHVLEPVEWVTNEKTGKKMLVYYSLGNFISHQIELYQLCGGMADITIEKNNGEISITSAKLIPIVTHYNRDENGKFQFNVYKLSDYTDDLASTHSQKGGTVEYYTKLVEKVVDEEFLA